MEKAKEWLELNGEETETVSQLTIHPHRVGLESSFYEDFALRGIRVDRVDPGLVTCTFKVPPRLTDKNGNLANGAIVNLIDVVGGAVVHIEGLPLSVSVDMSISFVSTAKLNDELEITSRVLGQRGGYSGTIVLIRNKATGEVITEGRHSLFVIGTGNIRISDRVREPENGESKGLFGTEQRRIGDRFTTHHPPAPSRRGRLELLRRFRFERHPSRPSRARPRSCTFKVPPRLTDNNGNLANGAIANLVDEVGGAVVYAEGLPMKVSVDMSISFVSSAKLDDELEITSRVLGQRGGYSGTIVLMRNKATGEVIAEGRHSLFGRQHSKM
ncbi:hypothetical protein LWI29_027763 [Acer saccharum]|uniref:Acyl-coenzyme A thioesterase 13 n=1 Tax=Acer saccharum TaxID=4024 RepID=A0AA39W7R3_ACESA|nr:hypothetical protein LWI29_027763 [Acer saccharum]